MFKKFFVYILVFSFFLNFIFVNNVFAVTASDNYKIYNGQVGSFSGSASSDNYGVDSGSNPISGVVSSDNYGVQQGSVFSSTAAEETGGEEETVSVTGGAGSTITVDTAPPAVEEINIVESTNSVEIFFETDEISVSYIQYGKDEAYDFQTGAEEGFLKDHSFVIGNLLPNTKYNFTIHLRDKIGNLVETKSYEFTTLPIIKTVVNVSNFKSTLLDTGIKLTWVNPDLDDLKNVKIVRSTVSYLSDPSQNVIFEGTGTSYLDTDVSSGNTYYYTIFVFDLSNNISSGAVSFLSIPSDKEIEKIKEEIVEQIEEKEEEVEVEEEITEEEKIEKEIEEKIEEAEIPDEIAFEDLIPAEPIIYLPEEIIEVEKDEAKLTDGIVKLFSIVKQSVSKGYKDTANVFKGLSTSTRDRVNTVKSGLVDKMGQLQQSVFEMLTPEEKEEIEKIIETPLPPVFEKEVAVDATPFDLKAEEYGADWHVFSESDSLISIPASVFEKQVNIIIATLKTEAYILKYNGETDSYEAVITAPSKKGKYEMIIQVIYTDNSYEELHKVVLVDPYGFVYTEQFKKWSWKKPWQIFTKTKVKVPFAKVSIYTLNKTNEWVLWPSHLYKQYNPQLTDETGAFAFIVPPGKYYLTTEAEGFDDFVGKEFEVEKEIVNLNIKLEKISTMYLKLGVFCGIILVLFISFVFVKRNKK